MSLPKDISSSLQVPESYVLAIAKSASKRYKRYTIRKRNGGFRYIDHPSKELKTLQRWLHLAIISQWPKHNAATAYHGGAKILNNASAHKGCAFLLKMDFKEYFRSISADDISRFVSKQAGPAATWDAADRRFFCRIVCRNWALTIGAPSSPGLANAICYQLDAEIHAYCQEHGVVYTRYADDLAFSTTEANVLRDVEAKVRDIVASTSLPASLRFNDQKTVHVAKGQHMRLTGLVLTSDGRVSIGRKRKREVKALVFNRSGLDPKQRASLAGTIAFIRDVDPEFFNRLIVKYGHSAVHEAISYPSDPPSPPASPPRIV